MKSPIINACPERRPRVLFFAILIFLSVTDSYSSARPGHSKQKMAWSVEILGGVLVGSGGAIVGSKIGSLSGDCKETEGWFGAQGEDCSSKLPGIFLGGILGYSLGNPLGIFLAGTVMDDEGSFMAAFLGGLFGEVVAIPIGFLLASSDYGGLALVSIAVIPALLGTAAYGSGGDPRARRPNLSELRWRPDALPSRGGLSQKKVFELNFLTVRF